MHNNLEAEITRKRINKQKIATTIGRTYNTLNLKISGKYPFTYDEAIKIQEEFFPECDLKDLFKKATN
ncbi:MAG: hypothetical protein RR657_01515 [Peptostreptococcaceae bacterium]